MRSPRQLLPLAALITAAAVGVTGCAAGSSQSASVAQGTPAASSVERDTAQAPSVAAAPAQGDAPSSRALSADAPAPEWSSVAPSIRSALSEATSLVVTGSTGSGAQEMETSARGTTKVDGDFEITMRQPSTNVEFTILRTGGASYMRGTPEAFAQMTGEASAESFQAVEGKYVRLDDATLAGLGEDTNVAGLRDELVSMTPAASSTLTGQADEFDGRETYSYAAKNVVVHVSRDADHAPVAFVATTGNDVYVLESVDAEVSIEAPGAADVVQLSELGTAAP